MLQRRRKRKTDPAIAALARELLEYGEFLQQPLNALEGGAPCTEALFARAREAAVRAGYWIGVTYCDAVLAHDALLGFGDLAAFKHALKFRKVIDAAAAILRADVGE